MVDHVKNMMFVAQYLQTNNIVIRLWRLQVILEGKEESTISPFWVTNGVDCCLVRFLWWHLVPYWKEYQGSLAHILRCKKRAIAKPKKASTEQKGVERLHLIDICPHTMTRSARCDGKYNNKHKTCMFK